MERAPHQPLSPEQIAATAAASKSGAGVWLLSHAKEMLLCAISFAAGVGGTLAVTNALTDKASSPPPIESTACVVSDTLPEETNSEVFIVYPAESAEHDVAEPEKRTSPPSSCPLVSSPKQETVKTTTPEPTVTSTTSEPVVVKKTVVNRDTVRIHETVIVKDTIVIEN